MTRIIIGSTAARQHIPDWREPKDLDVFTDAPRDGEDAFWDDSMRSQFGDADRVASLDELLTIKWSHAYWELPNGSWSKHMADILKLREHGAQLIPELHDLLYKVWETKHGVKRVDLNMDKSEFFDDAVRRTVDHDSLHLSVAFKPGRPLYELALKAGSTVAMDMDLVWSWPTDQVLDMFREEIYVTALERWIIPNDYEFSPGLAYQLALRKTITSLTKGLSAFFLVQQFGKLVRPTFDYVAHHRANEHYLEFL